MVPQTHGEIHAFGHPLITGGLPRYLLGIHEVLWACNSRQPWSSMLTSEQPHIPVGTHNFSWSSMTLAWSPTKNLKPHAFCWSSTRKLMGSHVACRVRASHTRWHPSAYTLRAYECGWARMGVHDTRNGHAHVICGHAREERQQPPTQRVEGYVATGFAMVL